MWVPRQGCTKSENYGNVAALATMLGYASDATNALGQLQQLNEAAKARAVAKVAAIGTQTTKKIGKYAESPSVQLQTTLANLGQSTTIPLPRKPMVPRYSLSPDMAAQVQQVIKASASPSATSLSDLSVSAASVATLQRSLSAPSTSRRLSGQDVLSPSVQAAVQHAVAGSNYAALSKVSPAVLAAAYAQPASTLPLSYRSMCRDLPLSQCLPPMCQTYKPAGKKRKCRANPQYGSLASLSSLIQ